RVADGGRVRPAGAAAGGNAGGSRHPARPPPPDRMDLRAAAEPRRQDMMEALSRLQFGARRLPVFLQTEAAECGLASLGMVACFHGHRADLAALRRRFAVALKGATLAYLMQAAGKQDLALRPLRLALDELPHP